MQDEDIKLAILSALDANGTAAEVKARIRSRIFAALQDKPETTIVKPPENVYLCNELIRDYLLKMGYLHSLSVFSEEVAGHDEMDRTLLSAEFKIKGTDIDDDGPLLLSILENNKK
jgi:hypothetical protein